MALIVVAVIPNNAAIPVRSVTDPLSLKDGLGVFVDEPVKSMRLPIIIDLPFKAIAIVRNTFILYILFKVYLNIYPNYIFFTVLVDFREIQRSDFLPNFSHFFRDKRLLLKNISNRLRKEFKKDPIILLLKSLDTPEVKLLGKYLSFILRLEKRHFSF